MTTLQPGQILGPYRILEQIGQGGMATVYKAYHAAMDRFVAVKVLPQQLAESTEFAGRFRQEARTIANLEHARILPVYDSGESDGVPYLVMRYLEAGTLKDRLKEGAPSQADADRWFTQLAEALDYAHRRGVIHRDLKPSNALVDAQGDLFLTDFGIAKLLESGVQFTTTGAMVGTPAYMSPEQAQAEKVDQRTDIYSLGIILYEMVTGRVPFEAETPLAVVLKQINAPLPLPTALKPNLSPAIERVLLKALAKNPADRYSTVAEFLTAWKQGLAESETARHAPIAAAPASPRPIIPAPTPARRNLPLILGGVAGLGVLCVLALALLSRINYSAAPEPTTPSVTLTASAPIPTDTVSTPDSSATVPQIPSTASGWKSWSAANYPLSATFVDDRVVAWGEGGLTFWDRADGSFIQQVLPHDGLPNVRVRAVLADEGNGLWVGTEDGLGFFDGQDWTIYDTDDGWDSSSVTALAFTSQHLIAGTSYSGVEGSGLMRYDGQTWERVPDFPSAEGEQPGRLSANVNVLLSTLLPDDVTVLWVGTEHGLGRYDGQAWTAFFDADGLPDNRILALMVDDEGVVYASTDNGAARFNGESFELIERTEGRAIYGMVVDANGDYWFSGDGGAARYNPARDDWTVFSEDSGDLPVYTLFGAARDEDGNLYFGSDGGGLLRYDGETFNAWTAPDALRARGYRYILPQPNGQLWFSEEYGGRVDAFDPQTEAWTPVELPCDYCTPLGFDAAGQLWVGGEEGVWIVPPGGGDATHITEAEGLPSNVAYTFAIVSDGHILVGTTAGVAHFEDGQITAIFNADNSGLANDGIRTLLSTSDGSIWVGVDGGVSRMMPDGVWEHFTVGNPFSEGSALVLGLVEDGQGDVWAALSSGGLWRYSSGEWSNTQTDSLNSISLAPDGSLWLGTYYHGAVRFDGADYTSYGVEDGLVHANVNHVYVDATGAVWFATSGGVSRLVP